MFRNLDRRVELLVPIEDPKLKRHLKDEVLDLYLRDNTKARRLMVDGTYERIKPGEGEAKHDSQAHFISLYS
jgi:polyphosphate kinase